MFLVNLLLAVFVIGPLEKKVGATFGVSTPDPEDLHWLRNLHFLALGLAGFLTTATLVAYSGYLADKERFERTAVKKSE